MAESLRVAPGPRLQISRSPASPRRCPIRGPSRSPAIRVFRARGLHGSVRAGRKHSGSPRSEDLPSVALNTQRALCEPVIGPFHHRSSTLAKRLPFTIEGLEGPFELISGESSPEGLKAYRRPSRTVLANSSVVWHCDRRPQTAISSMRVCLSGIRRSRHWDDRTPSSDSARSSQSCGSRLRSSVDLFHYV